MSSNITRSQSVPHDLDTVKKSERSIIAKLPKEKAEQLRRRLFSDNALDYKESIGIGQERYVSLCERYGETCFDIRLFTKDMQSTHKGITLNMSELKSLCQNIKYLNEKFEDYVFHNKQSLERVYIANKIFSIIKLNILNRILIDQEMAEL